MNKISTRLTAYSLPYSSLPAVLLLICLAAYGLLAFRLGFYWDDFPLIWIAEKLGPQGLERYFSTNRPFWGLLYQVTTPIFGSNPLLWQFFALFWRWAAALALFGLLRQVWPHAPRAAAWTSLLFAVYPGFGQQFISLVYSHFFIVLTIFFLSLFFNLAALRRPRLFWPFTLLALLLSALNLLAMEYFFLLEFVRPILIWWAGSDEKLSPRGRFKNTLTTWLPYLAVFLGSAIWRAFFFSFQTQNYQPVLLQKFSENPILAVQRLLGLILSSLWDVSFGAWGQALRPPDPAVLGARTTLVYALLVTGLFIALLIYLLKLRRPAPEAENWSWPAISSGLIVCAVAGWPFWLIEMRPSLVFPLDRFTLPFMMGTSLILAGLIQALPLKSWGKLTVLAFLVAFAAGWQFQLANAYRRDWDTQTRFFWQLTWRIPDLQPGTAILSADLPVTYYSDNSLTAPLNWIYSGDTDSDSLSYILLYPSARLGTKIPALERGLPVTEDYLAASFQGTTSQAVAVVYQPPACLRILDPPLDSKNLMLDTVMRHAALISTTGPIQIPADSPGRRPFEGLYGPEPAQAWCYYYLKADLARQQRDWEQVVALADTAFALGDSPNDPSERIPFIEGYAHTGNWERALEQNSLALRITPLMQPVLCSLWQRIDEAVPGSPQKEAALEAVQADLNCQY